MFTFNINQKTKGTEVDYLAFVQPPYFHDDIFRTYLTPHKFDRNLINVANSNNHKSMGLPILECQLIGEHKSKKYADYCRILNSKLSIYDINFIFKRPPHAYIGEMIEPIYQMAY